MDEIAQFLRAHPPFDAIAPAELARLAGAAEVCAFADGETIFAQGAAPQTSVWIVGAGSVELVDHGRVLDLLGPGELFGFSSMLAELPTGFAARARGETQCYRLPGDVTRPLLARPEALRHVTRTLLGRPTAGVPRPGESAPERPVAALLRAPAVRCGPDTPIATVARDMTDTGQTCAVVELRDGSLGILTDRDLRSRVLAAGLPSDAAVSQVMSAPAYTVPGDRMSGEVLVEMLDRGVRHFPVLSPTGALLGVVDTSTSSRPSAARPSTCARRSSGRPTPRSRWSRATSGPPWPRCTTRRSRPSTSRRSSRSSPTRSSAASSTSPSRTRGTAGAVRMAALGSIARREAVPSSDVDCAIAWDGDDSDPEIRAYMHRVAVRVLDGLAACGLRSDPKGATASHRLFARSLDAWGEAIDSWFDEPTQEKALILVSIVGDNRPVWGVLRAAPLAERQGRPLAARAPAPDGALRPVVPPADGVPARHRRRALGRPQGPPRPQARRPRAHHRPRPLGGHGGRRDRDLDPRAPARRARGGRADRLRRPRARGGVRARRRAAPRPPGRADPRRAAARRPPAARGARRR